MARRIPNIDGVIVAGHDGADQQIVKVDSSGALTVGGPAADDAAASGNPVPVGGIYNSSLPTTYVTGDRTQLQTDRNGNLRAKMVGTSMTFSDSLASSNQFAGVVVRDVDDTPRALIVGNTVYDGTNNGRQRTVVNATDSTGTGIAAAGLVGQYRATLPTITDTQFGNVQVDINGNLRAKLVGQRNTGADGISNELIYALAQDAAASQRLMTGAPHAFNGTTWDRQRNNQDVTVFSSAARTATPTPFDGVNYDGKSLHLVIDCTAVTSSPSVVFTLQGKDAISGKFYTILASAAIVGTGTTVLRVGPGLTTAANLVANDVLPRSYRVIATHGNSDSITYSVGMSIVNG